MAAKAVRKRPAARRVSAVTRKGAAAGRGSAAKGSAAGPVVRLDAKDATLDKFLDIYKRNQVILVRGCSLSASGDVGGSKKGADVTMKLLRDMYKQYPKVIDRAFYAERPPVDAKSKASTPAALAARLLGTTRAPPGPWYASFVVQRSRPALATFFKALPFRVPPFLRGRRAGAADGAGDAVQHSEAAWVFFGTTGQEGRALQGRSEHTDAIEHGGTWHVQLSGTKVWTLRPTSELARQSRGLRGVGPVRVVCRPGDVLCVNTRLWWHRTTIPGGCPLSLSVARDMFLDGTRPHAPDFTNVKGHYATRAFGRGEVVFTEDEAPNLELPASRTSNCGVRDVGGGELAIVAKRRISPGEWFSVSDSEGEEEECCTRPGKARKTSCSCTSGCC